MNAERLLPVVLSTAGRNALAPGATQTGDRVSTPEHDVDTVADALLRNDATGFIGVYGLHKLPQRPPVSQRAQNRTKEHGVCDLLETLAALESLTLSTRRRRTGTVATGIVGSTSRSIRPNSKPGHVPADCRWRLVQRAR